MFNDKEYDFEYKGHHMMKNIHVVSLLSIIIIIDLDVKGTVTGLSGIIIITMIIVIIILIIIVIIIINLNVKGTVTGLSGLTRGVGPALFKGVTKQLK